MGRASPIHLMKWTWGLFWAHLLSYFCANSRVQDKCLDMLLRRARTFLCTILACCCAPFGIDENETWVCPNKSAPQRALTRGVRGFLLDAMAWRYAVARTGDFAFARNSHMSLMFRSWSLPQF